MRISRHGSSANYGNYNIEIEAPEVNWDAISAQLIILKECVRDFTTPSDHDYTIRISLAEFVQMLGVVLTAIETDSGEAIIESMKSKLPELQRVIATITRPFELTPKNSEA